MIKLFFSDDYRRYRHTVIQRLPKLKFLDAAPVTATERSAASGSRSGSATKQQQRSAIVSSDPGLLANIDVHNNNNNNSSITSSRHNDAALEQNGNATADDEADDENHDDHAGTGVDSLPTRNPNEIHASYGVSAYSYVGKQSEGNRFILDEDL